jgi:hypothetical protein
LLVEVLALAAVGGVVPFLAVVGAELPWFGAD